MSNEIVPVRCSIVRGGTSKAIFLMNNQLPADPKAREKMILAIFGSPSLRQLDGLGGADISMAHMASVVKKLAELDGKAGRHDTLWLMD